MNQNRNVLVGTDPEAFVKNTETGEIVSAIGLIPGSKDRPHDISDAGHAIQTDNVMVEFCVPPASDPVGLYNDIQFCLAYINGMLPKGIETTILASARLDSKYLKSKQAKTFGCDPDFNVYSLSQNDAPSNKTNLRSAGGHIHVGYDQHNQVDNMKIVIAMDLFLGLPSILLDKDTERRKMYGKAGCFREKSYGVEYRTLSNFWIASQESVTWAFEQTHKAVEFALNNDWLEAQEQADIQLAINNQDLDLACKIAKKYDILMAYREYVSVL